MTKKMVNIRLEESIWRQAKIAAVAQGLTLQDWLTKAILNAVVRRAKGEQSDHNNNETDND